MMEHIIKASSREGDLVADFFMGSEATLKAALKHNRRVLEWKWKRNGLNRLRLKYIWYLQIVNAGRQLGIVFRLCFTRE